MRVRARASPGSSMFCTRRRRTCPAGSGQRVVHDSRIKAAVRTCAEVHVFLRVVSFEYCVGCELGGSSAQQPQAHSCAARKLPVCAFPQRRTAHTPHTTSTTLPGPLGLHGLAHSAGAGGRRAARRRGGGGGGCDYPKDGSSFITSDTAHLSRVLFSALSSPPTPVSRSSSETRLSHELEFDDSGSTNNHISPGAEESPGNTLPAPALSAPQPPPCCCSKVYPKRSMSACMYCATIRRVWSS